MVVNNKAVLTDNNRRQVSKNKAYRDKKELNTKSEKNRFENKDSIN